MLVNPDGTILKPVNVQEKHLQKFVENKLLRSLGIYLLASEYTIISETHNGRIDTLGMDSDGNPVVVEYKKDKSRTIINQSVYYMNYLRKNKSEFEQLAQSRLGQSIEISWSSPRIICIANMYSKHDQALAEDCVYNVELIQYEAYPNSYYAIEYAYQKETLTGIQTATNEDALCKFLGELAQFGVIHGNGGYYGTIFGWSKLVSTSISLKDGKGEYGGRGKKQPAEINGKDLVLIQVNDLINVLNERKKDDEKYNIKEIEMTIERMFKETQEMNKAAKVKGGLVLAPRQYETQNKMYTALSKEELLDKWPGFANITWATKPRK